MPYKYSPDNFNEEFEKTVFKRLIQGHRLLRGKWLYSKQLAYTGSEPKWLVSRSHNINYNVIYKEIPHISPLEPLPGLLSCQK